MQDDTLLNYQMKTSDDDINIPIGHTLITGRGKHPVLVPTFLVPSTLMAMETQNTRSDLNADNAVRGVSDFQPIMIILNNWIIQAAAVSKRNI